MRVEVSRKANALVNETTEDNTKKLEVQIALLIVLQLPG
jgi:hypothetical protein